MTALPKTKMTLEEYFELDNTAEGRFEYFDGEVFEMSGAHPTHDRLERRLGRLLEDGLEARNCHVFGSSLRVSVPALPPHRYPDLTALCGKPEFINIGGLPCLANPVLIVEILSDSTSAFDLKDKFEGYKSIASFREYLLIAQDRKFVMRYLKQAERFWLQSTYGAGEIVPIESLGCELDVDALYQGIDFASETGF
jgi:Uma2 family endonuclease